VLGNPEVESAYGVTSLPTLFVLDRRGQLVKQLVGSADEATVVALIERLAAQ
jgi:thioredoxin-related protein